ncbi:MAG TPA: type II toxin-antitoxin system HicA family toxin [Rhizomicrobium sp.]|nr:type II toxin-antitoxin system HicA family toxin [Rhizomicrobium sp.]
MTPREMRRILEQNGFVFTRQSGSHAIFKHPVNKRRVVLPIHSGDIPTGTCRAILKDAGLKPPGK